MALSCALMEIRSGEMKIHSSDRRIFWHELTPSIRF
jgi:hypothetical protein